MTRRQANLTILDHIEQYILNNPEVRFNQALFNLGINELETTLDLDSGFDRTFLKDKYNEESEITLKNLKQ